MNRWFVFTVLLLVYLALSNNFEWRNWVVGVLAAGIVLWLLRLEKKQIRLQYVPIVIWTTIRYLLQLIWDVMRSGIDLVRIVFSPSLPIRPGVFAVPCMGRSKLGTALSAHALTLAPGELVIAIGEDNTLYTHALHARETENGQLELDCRRCELLWEIIDRAGGKGRFE